MKERACQAEYHVDNCPCIDCGRQSCGNCKSTNVDHFTAKCVGKALGMRPKEINRSENLQYLSRPCHTAKDRSTPARARMAYSQKRGAFISLDQYRRFVKRNDYSYEEKEL